jgi:hypothetical protein
LIFASSAIAGPFLSAARRQGPNVQSSLYPRPVNGEQ